jgi:hypothetical protein
MSSMNRAIALAEILRSHEFVCEVDHDVVNIAAPERSAAHVQVGADYLCSFTAPPPAAALVRGSAKRWANWTARVRAAVADSWMDVMCFDMPPPRPIEPSKPREPIYAHDYPLHVRLDDGVVYAFQESREGDGRLVVVTRWELQDDSAAPRISWHEWAKPIAERMGAEKGWQQIEGREIGDQHPAGAVRQILQEAARQLKMPTGIIALDLHGLHTSIVEALGQALVENRRTGIVLCSSLAAAILERHVLK